MPEQVIVGGTIAALVVADALAGHGETVRLLLPERGVGGGFAALRRDGRELELGVRLLELSYEGAPDQTPSLSAYRPAIGGHRQYAPLVDSWLRELLPDRLVESERPRMFFDGRAVDDLYFTTDARVLREALSGPERQIMLGEGRKALTAAGRDGGVLDPSYAEDLGEMLLDEASRRNHGETFHRRLVAPIAAKLVPDGAARVIATHRRKIWIPLFWPITLVQALDNGDVAFQPTRPFHRVTSNGSGGLVEALLDRIRARGVRIEAYGRLDRLTSSEGGAVEMWFSDAGSVRARKPVLGLAPAELFQGVGAPYTPEMARSVICWVEIEPRELAWTPDLLTVVDPEIPALRVSSGGSGAPGMQLLTIELRHDVPADEIERAARSTLSQLGLVAPGAAVHVVTKVAGSSFAMPTRATKTAFERAQLAVQSAGLDAEIVGGATAFGADSLGDQIIQGLQAAEEVLSWH